MIKNKFFRLFNTLTPKETKALKEFTSIYGSTDTIKLIDYLAKKKPSSKPIDPDIQREKTLNKLFPSAKVNDQKRRRILAHASQIVVDFLKVDELKSDTFVGEELLRAQLKKRNLNDFYLASLRSTERELTDNPNRDFYHYEQMIRLRHQFFFNVQTNKYKEKDLLDDLDAIHNDLDNGYILAKLHYSLQSQIIKMIRGENRDKGQINVAAELAKEKINEPLIKLYYQLICFIGQPESVMIKEAKALFFKHSKELHQELQAQLLVVFINLTYLNPEEENMNASLWELYFFGVESQLFLTPGGFEASHFNNIIALGSSLKKFDFIRKFIAEYFPHLRMERDARNNVKTYYEASLLFSEGKYDEALLHLHYLEFNDFSYGLRAYLLIIKSLYESKKTKSYKELDTRCDSFKQYIHRKFKQGFINKTSREENLNFIKIARQLPFASSSKFARISTTELKEKVKAMTRVVNRPWLLEKIEQLEGK